MGPRRSSQGGRQKAPASKVAIRRAGGKPKSALHLEDESIDERILGTDDHEAHLVLLWPPLVGLLIGLR